MRSWQHITTTASFTSNLWEVGRTYEKLEANNNKINSKTNEESLLNLHDRHHLPLTGRAAAKSAKQWTTTSPNTNNSPARPSYNFNKSSPIKKWLIRQQLLMITTTTMKFVFAQNFITIRPVMTVHAQSGAGLCGVPACIVQRVVRVRCALTGSVTAPAQDVTRMVTMAVTMTMTMTVTMTMTMTMTMEHTEALKMVVTMTMTMMMMITNLPMMTNMWSSIWTDTKGVSMMRTKGLQKQTVKQIAS